MGTPAVIAGSYADLKTIRTRQVLQMVIEIPLEDGEKLIDAFGFPAPGAEIRVAVARLNPVVGIPATEQKQPVGKEVGPTDPLKSARAKQAYSDASEGEKAVTRAAMLCSDPEFQSWCHNGGDEVGTAAYLRQALGIQSRKEIASMPILEAFKLIEMEFAVSTGRAADPR